MKKWVDRPIEIKNLFNPAFCAVVMLRSLEGFKREDNSGMPFSLSLLILPICLHEEFRRIIIDNKQSYLLKIIIDHPRIILGFAERTRYLLPYTFEALGLAKQLNSFNVTEKGHLLLLDRGIKKTIKGTEESITCQKVAQIIGKNFARINDRITIYTSLGIRP